MLVSCLVGVVGWKVMSLGGASFKFLRLNYCTWPRSMAQPKVWLQTDGETTTVHTPFTTRAKASQ